MAQQKDRPQLLAPTLRLKLNAAIIISVLAQTSGFKVH